MKAKVSDVMTTPVVAVRPGTSFKELAVLFRKYRVSGFPVLGDDQQKVIGVVSEADLLAKEALSANRDGTLAAIMRHRDLKKADGVTAGELMTRNVVTVRPDDTVEHAARLMYHLQVKRLPVVDPLGSLVGIVSRADLLTVFDRTDGEIRAEIVNDVILHEFLIDPALFRVTVTDGVVTVGGAPETAQMGHNVMSRIRTIRGVVAVRDELSYPPEIRPAGPDDFDAVRSCSRPTCL